MDHAILQRMLLAPLVCAVLACSSQAQTPAAAPPQFSIPGGIYPNTISVALTKSTPGGVIRYTTNTTEPTVASAPYSVPIVISASTQIKAKTFEDGGAVSATVAAAYTILSADAQNFTSNLPIVVINTFGKGITAETKITSHMRFINAASGRSALTHQPEYSGRAGIEIRGSSSTQFPKKSYGFEIQDATGADLSAPLFGMPAEADWVLYAPYTDKTMMRDVLVYQMGRDMGRDAMRSRFVEVFVDTTGQLTYASDYAGVYVLLEKISRDDDRVDIEKLTPLDNTEPAITGGYIVKKDRLDANDSQFTTNGGGAAGSALGAVPQALGIEYPKGSQITAAQKAWITNYMNQFEAALYGAAFKDPLNGYAKYIDVDSFIDHHWMVEFSKNIDGYRLSEFMYKKRGGKLVAGPFWDFNLSLGNANYLGGGQSAGWYWSQLSAGDYPWRKRLFQDPDFTQKYIDRWAELRKDLLTTANVLARVDARTAELNEAQVRNFRRWPILDEYVWPNFYYQTDSLNDSVYDQGVEWIKEVNWMKGWIQGRLAWIDSQYVIAPVLSRPGGSIVPGESITIISPGGGTLYYTTNGTDPRAPGGGLAPGAQIYSGPITVSNNVRIVARAKTTQWSAPASASYIVEIPRLVITEIMYSPFAAPAGSGYSAEDFEYIELRNVGDKPVSLPGTRFTAGIAFTFAATGIAILAPGERVLVVRNLAAFTSRYGNRPNIAGVYSGSLDNNDDHVVLEGPMGEPLHDFTYKNGWYPATDGGGFSLVILDDTASPALWNLKESWGVSGTIGGTPGGENTRSLVMPVLINEVLTHTDPPLQDSIELYNPNGVPVDVGHWFITDARATPGKFQIPPGTMIAADGYLVLTEADFNTGPQPFTFDSHGEEAYLYSAAEGGVLTGYSHGVSFGASQNGVSFGRYVTSEGEIEYPAQAYLTLGSANAGPRVGPVVINEVMYHPAAGKAEFVELKNISGSAVTLHDPANPSNTWKIAGLGYSFPPNTTIPAGGVLLVVSGDAGAFRTSNSVPAGIQVLAQFGGELKNEGESLQLQFPDTPETGVGGTVYVPYVTMDEVSYEPFAPWPTAAAGSGASIERIFQESYGNDPANWRASTGGGSTGIDNSVDGRPSITLSTEPAAATYIENSEGAVLDGGATVSDPNNGDFEGGTLTVNLVNSAGADDRLMIQVGGSGAGQIGLSGNIVTYAGAPIGTLAGINGGGSSLVVQFTSAAATSTAAEALVRSVAFVNIGGVPTAAARAASFILYDGDGGTSAPVTRAITVVAVNDPPSFASGPSQSVKNGSITHTFSNWATSISPGPADEAGQSVTFSVLAANPALFSSPPTVSPDGTLTFTIAAGAIGTSTISITARDDGGVANGGQDSSESHEFSITVQTGNIAPSFTKGGNISVPQSSQPFTQTNWATNISAGPADEAGQLLTFLVEVDNPLLFTVPPTLSSNGTLSFTPSATGSGSTNVNVRLKDNGGLANGGFDTSALQTFSIAVTSFVEETGLYNGLAAPVAGQTPRVDKLGLLKLKIGSAGTFTMRLKMGAYDFVQLGQFNNAGVAYFGNSGAPTIALKRPGLPPLILSLLLDVSGGTDTLTGTIHENGLPFASIEAGRVIYTEALNPIAPMINVPAELRGRYTVVFAAKSPDDQGLTPNQYPQADGYGTLKVNTAGTATLVGRLADGTKISYGNHLSKLNSWPFWVAFSKGKGAISGWVLFRDLPTTDLDGQNLAWFKPARAGRKRYSEGWSRGIRVDLLGSTYKVPAATPPTSVLPGLGPDDTDGNAELEMTEGNLSSAGLIKALSIASDNGVRVIVRAADKLAVDIQKKSGRFTGTFVHPTTRTETTFDGVIFQKQSTGSGFFLGGTESGSITIVPDDSPAKP